MAAPNSRGQLINFGLRKLGYPVLEINLDTDQIHDALDDTGLQRSTNAPQTPVITSKQVLTAITKITLSSLSAAITVAVGDIIKQDTTGAFGVVETAVTGGNSVNLIGVEGTFNTTNNLRREGQSGAISNLASVPGAVANVYINKPHWTSTLDGGTF